MEYFFDECTTWELNDILENIPYLNRSSWEQSRLQTYVIAQVNSKKKLTQQDILKFKWEDMSGMLAEEHDTSISKYDIQRLENLASELGNAKTDGT